MPARKDRTPQEKIAQHDNNPHTRERGSLLPPPVSGETAVQQSPVKKPGDGRRDLAGVPRPIISPMDASPNTPCENAERHQGKTPDQENVVVTVQGFERREAFIEQGPFLIFQL